MQEQMWVLCPACGGKTRIRVLEETVLRKFPLFCPKCRREYLVDVQRGEIQVHTIEPDAKTQS